jgi:hypothetical protein
MNTYVVAWRTPDGAWHIDPRPHTRDSAHERTQEREQLGYHVLAAELDGLWEHFT